MSSQEASPKGTTREPRGEKAKKRVATLLQAADKIFAEKGFDAATMTEIASLAGAAIGSLYQYFPTKEAVAEALFRAQLQQLLDLFEQLKERALGLTPAELGDLLLAEIAGFIQSHASIGELVNRRMPCAAIKHLVRDSVIASLLPLLQSTTPPLSAERAQVIALIFLHFMRAHIFIALEPSADFQALMREEFRLMLRGRMEILH